MLLQELTTKLGFEVHEKPLEKLEHTLEGVHHKLEFLAAVEIVKGLFELAERFAGMGEQLETAAIQAGITAEEFQKLAYAASQNAVSQDEFSGALAKLARTLQHAKDGSEKAVETFARIGIDESQLQSFNNAEDAFLAIQDAIAKIDDPLKRVAATQEVFGRGSSKMVKLLLKGSSETRRLMKEAGDIGGVLSEQGVEDLANFEDAFSGLRQVVSTALASIGATFAPVFTEIIHRIEKFWMLNQQLVRTDMAAWGKKVAYGFGFVFGAIEIVSGVLAKFIRQHPELVENIAKVVGALMVLSLTTTGLGLLLTGVKDVVAALGKTASIGMPTLVGMFKAGRWGAGTMLKVVGSLLLHLGYAVHTLFPSLGNAIFNLGSKLTVLAANPLFLTIAGVTAALVSAFVILHDIWTLMHGGSFADTWIGEGLAALKSKGGSAISLIKSMFGMGADALGSGPASGMDGGGTDWLKAMDGAAGAFNAQNLVPSFGTGALQGLAAQSMPMGQGAALAAAAPMLPDSAVTYNINSPITINAPPGSNPQDIARMVQEAAQKVFDGNVRQAHRDHAPAAAR